MMAEDDNHHFGAIDETTKRLVGRCGRVGWLKDEETPGLSPTWVKNRLLSVDLPSAMQSNLSVVEVTTQRERPGVQTHSASEKNGKIVGVSEKSNSGAVMAGNDGIVKGVGVGQSPFEVDGGP